MNRIRQWTVQQPRWATVLAAGIIFAAASALAYVAAPHVVTAAHVVAAPLVGATFPECGHPLGCQGFATHKGWRHIILGLVSVAAALAAAILAFRGKPLFRGKTPATLEFDGARQWVLVNAAVRRPLQLTHAWPAFAWVRLRFRAALAAGSKETMLELTIWKASISPEAWRELRVLLARQATLPEWRAEKGGGR
jgi:hypothetical protein